MRQHSGVKIIEEKIFVSVFVLRVFGKRKSLSEIFFFMDDCSWL
jgi:hypothetical protein